MKLMACVLVVAGSGLKNHFSPFRRYDFSYLFFKNGSFDAFGFSTSVEPLCVYIYVYACL